MKKTILLLVLALSTTAMNAQDKKKTTPASPKPTTQQKDTRPASQPNADKPAAPQKEAKPDTNSPAKLGEASQDMSMAAMMEYMKPGRYHEILSLTAGEWKESIETWTSPQSDPVKFEASCTVKMIFGNLYQETVHTGDFNGMPFSGHGIVGYDNVWEKYVSTWYDNMGSGIMYTEGTYNTESRSLTFTGEMVDPVLKRKVSIREVITPKADNVQVFEMFVTPPDGKEYKSMQITMTR